jgi:simple sugar transport system permease protein
MTGGLEAFLQGTIRTATPLALAAMGETIAERAGVINIGLEGSIIAGALAATIAAPGLGVGVGTVAAMVAGLVVALLFALFVVTLRADQIITGTAISMLALGATGTIYRLLYGQMGAALTVPTIGTMRIPGISSIPIVGRALFEQPAVTYVAYMLVPLVAWWMYRTHAGLALRAVGESPEAAAASGVRVARLRTLAIAVDGLLGGLAGATLVLAQAGTFVEGMSAGRGFIAIAIVALGRWRPIGVALAALVFGAASALQYFFQAAGTHAPYQLFLALPYLLTLVALATARGRSIAPAALARAEDAE